MSTQTFISYERDRSTATGVLERLREVLMSEASEDLFCRALGPHADCFSISQVIRMFESGASRDELAHLLGRTIHHDLVTQSSKVGRVPDVGEEANPSQGFGSLFRDLVLRRGLSPPTAAAVLGLSDPLVAVNDPNEDVTVTCELVPCVGPGFDSIDPFSLRLEGAIAAESGTLTRPTDKSTPPRVTFRKAKLSKKTRRSLAHNARVVDEIRVSGAFAGERTRAFVGHAKIEFVRPL